MLCGGLLYYYEKKIPSSKPCGVIDLQYMGLQYDGDKEIRLETQQYTFLSHKRIYCLIADSPKEAFNWTKHLRRETADGIDLPMMLTQIQ